jgi:type IV pilus assembly protein PilA
MYNRHTEIERKLSQRKCEGFSLVELLIVITIILVIAAIAMPNLLRARRSANEASAIASMRAIGTAEMMYRASHGRYADMAGLRSDNAIPEDLASGKKSGYLFGVALGQDPSSQFTALGQPQIAKGATATGLRHFFMDESLVIRSKVGEPATVNDPPLGD